jgi:hypothetical protein
MYQEAQTFGLFFKIGDFSLVCKADDKTNNHIPLSLPFVPFAHWPSATRVGREVHTKATDIWLEANPFRSSLSSF